ncbi:MAG: hypothetical protein GC178_01330 [Flavobacteriales bacterium]|nr:hypothetical protein [Flavobacteriales bacterium]
MQTQQIELINGTFSPQDAKEIVLTVLEDKIRFHNIKVISGFERGTDTSASTHRIAELKESCRFMHQVTEKAEKDRAELRIQATISITSSVPQEVCQTTD